MNLHTTDKRQLITAVEILSDVVDKTKVGSYRNIL